MLLEFASWVDLHISTSLLLSMFGLLCVTILVAQYFALVYFAEQRVQGDCDTSRQCGAGFVCGFNREYNRKMCHRAGAVLCSAKPDDLRACTVGGTCPCANDTPFACKSVKYPTLEYSGAAPALDFQASHVPVANHTGCGSARGDGRLADPIGGDGGKPRRRVPEELHFDGQSGQHRGYIESNECQRLSVRHYLVR